MIQCKGGDIVFDNQGGVLLQITYGKQKQKHTNIACRSTKILVSRFRTQGWGHVVDAGMKENDYITSLDNNLVANILDFTDYKLLWKKCTKVKVL